LGADKRVFQRLHLPGVSFNYIVWLPPASKREPLAHYVRRLSEQIDTSQEVVLIGVSFGGIVAQELSRLVPCRQVIIISSVKSPLEYSIPLKLVKWVHMYALMPPGWLKKAPAFLTDYFFGVHSPEESALLQTIIRETPDDFLSWAISAIMQWEGGPAVPQLLHLHGTRDRIFPIQSIHNCIPVEGGGHFMILNKAAQLSQLITEKKEEWNKGHRKLEG
jgi:pimeloyl-ACP methyl ester carboxylesterase